jgi:glutathione peroxidase
MLDNFDIKDALGKPVDLMQFQGKTLLIVNTASECGLTPQFKGLEELYQQFKDQGLVILGFPCNQFKEQEPGTAVEAMTFCQTKYNVTFPMMEKIEVNGENAHPFYKWLKKQAPFTGFNLETPFGQKLHTMLSAVAPKYFQSDEIKWNFTKFLIEKTGKVQRFEPPVDPHHLVKVIQEVI